MKKTGIMTDSHSGILNEEAERLGIKVLPMPFYIEEKVYREGVDLSREEFYDNKQNRIMEFLLYYKENKNFNINEITYYCVDRSYLKEVINNFSLPNNLHQYRTILSKSKLALRMMMKSDDYILSYVNHFKSIIDNDLEREVFSYLAEREEQNLDGHIKEIHQYLCKKYKNLSKNDIEEAMKNLLLKGFISLYI